VVVELVVENARTTEKACSGRVYASARMQTHNTYARWGGLIAALAQCDSFADDRANEPGLASTFAMVDRLEAACANCGDFMTVAEALRSSNLTSTEVCRLASPLLDGLWTLVTGFEPTPYYSLNTESRQINVSKPRNPVRLLARLLQPKAGIDTIEWLGLLRWPLSTAFAKDRSLLIAAASAGRSEVVQYLLQHDMTLGAGAACEQAAAHGYRDIVSMCLHYNASFSYAETVQVVLAAVEGGDALILDLVLSWVPELTHQALVSAGISDDAAAYQFILNRCDDNEKRAQLSLLGDMQSLGPRMMKFFWALESGQYSDSLDAASCCFDEFLLPACDDWDWLREALLAPSGPDWIRGMLTHRLHGWEGIMSNHIQRAFDDGRLEDAKLLISLPGIDVVVASDRTSMARLLCGAIRWVNAEMVAYALERGATVTDESGPPYQFIPICIAAAVKNAAILEMLLAAADKQYPEEAAGLRQRCAMNPFDLFRDLPVDSSSRSNALDAAARLGHVDVVEQLLPPRQVYRKRPFAGGFDSYLTAIKNGQCAVVKLFKASGCDLNYLHRVTYERREYYHKRTQNAITAACAAGHLEVIRVVCRRLDWPTWKSFASRMLVAAAQGGHVDIVSFVIGHIWRLPTASITSVYERWFLCGLVRAALCGRVGTCLCLLDAIRCRPGVNADLASKLEHALRGVTSPQELVRAIQALDDYGWQDYDSYLEAREDSEVRHPASVLHEAFVLAAGHGQLSIVQYFIDCGVVRIRADRDSALRAAEQGGHSQIVAVLRARGAGRARFIDASPSTSSVASIGVGRNELERKVSSAGW